MMPQPTVNPLGSSTTIWFSYQSASLLSFEQCPAALRSVVEAPAPRRETPCRSWTALRSVKTPGPSWSVPPPSRCR